MSIDYILIDTNSMPVEEDVRNPGKKTQLLLSRELTGGGVVRLSYWPPGFTEGIRKLIAPHGGHRHYHRSVNERHYVLGGDWTSLYWPDPQGPAEQTRLYRHHYLENPPMTLHGISSEAPPVTGTKFLVWTSGPGTDIYEPEAKTESFDVEFRGEAPADLQGTPIMFNAEDREWQAHPRQPFLVKELSPPQPNIPGVTLVNIPPGTKARINEPSPEGPVRRWLFIVSGDLQLDVQSQQGTVPAKLKEGGFLAWMSQASVTSEDRVLSSGGCVAICIGHTLDDVAAKAN